jgi:hypothetical protein
MKDKKQSTPLNAEILKTCLKFSDSNGNKVLSWKLNGVALPSNHDPRFHSERDIDIFKTLLI